MRVEDEAVSQHKRQSLLAVLALGAVTVLASQWGAAWASVSDTKFDHHPNCTIYFGTSSYSINPPDAFTIASASTGKYQGTCNDQFHVHTYFWGSDSQYHYYEKTDNAATQIQVVFSLTGSGPPYYWSNDVISYHHYPGPGSAFSTRAN